MIIYDLEQGTPEWFQCRAGKLTASRVRDIRRSEPLTKQQRIYVDALRSGLEQDQAMKVAGYKRKPTSKLIDDAVAGKELQLEPFSPAARKVAMELACQRVAGDVIDQERFDTWATKRGHELEIVARGLHEEKRNVFVEQAGFICDDDEKFGVSVDGFLGDDGIAEYKCFVDGAKIHDFLTGDLSGVMDQIQCGMMITARAWCDFVLYVPKIPLMVWRVQRDDDFIKAMLKDMDDFDELIESCVTLIKTKVGEA